MECMLLLLLLFNSPFHLKFCCGRVGDPTLSDTRTRTHDIKYCTTLDTNTIYRYHWLIAFVNFYSFSLLLLLVLVLECCSILFRRRRSWSFAFCLFSYIFSTRMTAARSLTGAAGKTAHTMSHMLYFL